MTLKVLIADDEHWVCELIQRLIDWDSFNLELAGVVENGRDAFNFIKNNNPDIVITDIRMSGYNGIELIRKTRQINSKTNFIIVSGYREFEYAHNAISYSVDDYVLKPIKKDDLTKAIKKIIFRLNENERREKDTDQLKNQLDNMDELLKKQFFNDVIGSPQLFMKLSEEDIYKQYKIKFPHKSVIVLCIAIDGVSRDEGLISTHRVVSEVMIAAFAEKEYRFEYGLYNKLSVFFINAAFFDMNSFNDDLEKILIKSRLVQSDLRSLHITIGMSSTDSWTSSKLAQAALESYKAIKCRIVSGRNIIIDYKKQNFADIKWKKILSPVFIQKFINYIESANIDGIKKQIELRFNEMQLTENLNPLVYFDVCKRMFEIVENCHGNYEYSDNEYELCLQSAGSVNDLKSKITKLLIDKINQFLITKSLDDDLIIRKAKEYISANYNKQITLEDLSKRVNLNPVYFSVLFKNSTGQNFLEYLTNFRIEISKELLLNTYANISEIAVRVGYSDSRYFSKVFTRIMGIKPKDYRNLYS